MTPRDTVLAGGLSIKKAESYYSLLMKIVFCLQGFRVEAIWGRTNEEAAATAFALDIPFATNRIDDVLLRKDVDLILILCSPLHHSQIAVKALGNDRQDPNTVMI